MSSLSLLLVLSLIIIGFIGLVYGASLLIEGGMSIANRLGLFSNLLIGFTIVALGSSLTEIIISITSVIAKTPNLAIGNAIGSNITNIALVLAVAMIIRPVKIQPQIMYREMPLLFIVMFICRLLILNRTLMWVDGLILILIAVVMMWFLVSSYAKKDIDNTTSVMPGELKIPAKKHRLSKCILQLTAGVVLLPISSHLIVTNTVVVAKVFNVSHIVLGLTVFSFGTSLPELATCIVGVYKKKPALVLGTILGSNVFNLLVVLAIPALFSTIRLDHIFLVRDFTLMLFTAIVLYLFAFIGLRGRGYLNRLEGVLLLVVYAGYMLFIAFG